MESVYKSPHNAGSSLVLGSFVTLPKIVYLHNKLIIRVNYVNRQDLQRNRRSYHFTQFLYTSELCFIEFAVRLFFVFRFNNFIVNHMSRKFHLNVVNNIHEV